MKRISRKSVLIVLLIMATMVFSGTMTFAAQKSAAQKLAA